MVEPASSLTQVVPMFFRSFQAETEHSRGTAPQ